MKAMAKLSWEQWLDTITQIHHKRIDLGLTRLRQVAKTLDLLLWSMPVVVVGGTNGKGSTVALLSDLYGRQGYTTAAFTSPHLFDLTERLHINQQPLDRLQWMKAFEQVNQARGQLPLSFFEFTFLASLWLCRQQPLDVLILEVGLGGRLDAVNCLDADLAIITSIGLDHQDYLGDTREAIAVEKAGIFRAGQPVVCGDRFPPESLVAAAQDLHAPWYSIEEVWPVVQAALPSRLHPHNVACCYLAARCLQKKLPVSLDSALKNLVQVSLIGRFEQWRCPTKQGEIPVVFDVAHNSDSVAHLVSRLPGLAIQGVIHAVFSMLDDKPCSDVVDQLRSYVASWYLAPVRSERSMTAKALLQAVGPSNAVVCGSIAGAVQAAVAAWEPGDCLLVCGSFYTVKEAQLAITNEQ